MKVMEQHLKDSDKVNEKNKQAIKAIVSEALQSYVEAVDKHSRARATGEFLIASGEVLLIVIPPLKFIPPDQIERLKAETVAPEREQLPGDKIIGPSTDVKMKSRKPSELGVLRDPERQTKCPHCGKKFNGLHGLEVHIGKMHKKTGD